MKILIPLFPLLLLFSCQNADPNRPPKRMSAKDSTLYMKLWLGQERKENFQEMVRQNPPTGLITCSWGSGMNTLRIKSNRKGQLMIRGDIKHGIIKSSVIRFLTFNMQQNLEGNNYPLYGRTDLDKIEREIKLIEREIKKIANNELAEPIVEFKQGQLDEWKLKHKVTKTLKVESLPEIHPQSFIEFESTKNSKLNYSVSDSVFLAHFGIRDSLSEIYFKEPYLEIYRRYLIYKESKDDDKLEALKMLMPIRFVDWPNLDKYEHVRRRVIPPPPVLVE